jgi:hypothetical protein
MSWTTRSRLTNVTWPPVATVASYGIMPNGVIDTVVEFEGGAGAGAGDGVGAGAGDGAGGVGLAGVEPHPGAAKVSVRATTHAPGKWFSRDVMVVCRNG